MLSYKSIQELIEAAVKQDQCISDVVLADQAAALEQDPENLIQTMLQRLEVMRQAVEKGLADAGPSPSGLSGGAASSLRQALNKKQSVLDPVLVQVMAKALAVAEVNAKMGRIVAAPTAGSCGIIPGIVLTVGELQSISDRQIALSLFTASGFGLVIANRASLSGAEGGCQAECGSAAGMAAAAAVELMGGTPEQSAHACAIALKNCLGLVCDPVAGLVEVPCIKRNAGQAASALAAAEMALAGITSAIPVDEVIEAMKDVGNQMSVTLKETAAGGLAMTPTGQAVDARLTEDAASHLD